MVKKKEAAQEAAALPRQLWTIDDVIPFLQVSRRRVFQLIDEEGLPCIRWDRTLRFDPREIDRWLKEQNVA
jgi:hypothetical protein